MQYAVFVLVSVGALAGAEVARQDKPAVDCSRKSLAEAVEKGDKDGTIVFTGTCVGPIVIKTDGLTLSGTGTAVIDGGGKDAVTILGAHGVRLENLEIQNGVNGISGINGAHFNLQNVNVHDNFVFGITLQTSSSVIATAVTTRRNGVHGLDLQTGSSATISGAFTSANNRVFGINVNGSSITFSRATLNVTANALGMQVATGGNAFLNDAATVLNFTNNQSTGLTVVSGAHLVSFGGTINASGNPVNGVSVNSKGGLDLDAGSTLNSSRNGGDGVVLQENSVMTVFNIPQFSGVQGFSTVNASNNTGNGITVRNGSTLTLSNQARVISQGNTKVGLVGDNGAGVTLVNSNLTNNTVRDLQLSFGSRADLQTLTLGTYACDLTVLARGTNTVTCPH